MLEVILKIAAVIVCLIISIPVYSLFGNSIAENSTVQNNNFIKYIGDKVLEIEQWFLDMSIGYKILSCVIMVVIIIVLILICKLDEHFRDLPGGEVLEDIFGESIFEEHNIFRLIPGMLFTLYVFLRFAITIRNENAKFDFINFSLLGKNYTVYMWITQIFYFLIVCFMIILIFDSFLSAGFIGGVIHLAAVISANAVMMFLGLIVGAFAVLFLLVVSIVKKFFGSPWELSDYF